MKRTLRSTRPGAVSLWRVLALAAVAIPADSVACQTRDAAEVRNLVFMVADGAGVGTWSLARLALDDGLAVGRMSVVGLVDTRNSSGGLTDSAAGMTAYATGTRTYNRAIAVSPECRELMAGDAALYTRRPETCAPLRTIAEDAERRGMATGLVTTTDVTDATPAALVAHAPERDMRDAIARQMVASGVDVVLGGGRRRFTGRAETDGVDLLSSWCRQASCVMDPDALGRAVGAGRPVVGLFAERDLPRAGRRAPDLPALTRAALEHLEADPDGLFLLVETEGTDSYQHDNDPLELIEREIVEFDRAVAEALAFADRVPGTLVVVTADHETGGLAIHGRSEDPAAELRYTTDDHTHAMVPLFAHGPGAERLAGIRSNDEVGRILRELLIGER